VHVDERKLESGITSVFIAITTGNIEMLDVLRKYGADFRIQAQVAGGEFMQPIHLACKLGNMKVIEYLLEKDDNPNEMIDTVTLPRHMTVMHMAASGGNTEMIDFLTSKGISTIAKNA
jgi:ankyrin repeat protein